MDNKTMAMICLSVMYLLNAIMTYIHPNKDARHEANIKSDIYAASFIVVLVM